jgi:hypothetical protein
MLDQPISGAGDLRARLDCAERAVLGLLLYSEFWGPWSDAELDRAIDGEIPAGDAVAGLHAAGLVHRCEGFVWATRAAVRASRLGSGL